MYAAAEMDLLLRLSDGASLAFDVGAHWGYSTLVMSRGAKRIVAVEHVPGNLANLGATVAANDSPNESTSSSQRSARSRA
jgi:predicted O-methyltransferase YrrM